MGDSMGMRGLFEKSSVANGRVIVDDGEQPPTDGRQYAYATDTTNVVKSGVVEGLFKDEFLQNPRDIKGYWLKVLRKSLARNLFDFEFKNNQPILEAKVWQLIDGDKSWIDIYSYGADPFMDQILSEVWGAMNKIRKFMQGISEANEREKERRGEVTTASSMAMKGEKKSDVLTLEQKNFLFAIFKKWLSRYLNRRDFHRTYKRGKEHIRDGNRQERENQVSLNSQHLFIQLGLPNAGYYTVVQKSESSGISHVQAAKQILKRNRKRVPSYDGDDLILFLTEAVELNQPIIKRLQKLFLGK